MQRNLRRGGDNPHLLPPRRSRRERFGICRVCLGRVAPADRFDCAGCGVCAHRCCAQAGAWRARDGELGGGWLCSSCGLDSDSDSQSEGDEAAAAAPERATGAAAEARARAEAAAVAAEAAHSLAEVADAAVQSVSASYGAVEAKERAKVATATSPAAEEWVKVISEESAGRSASDSRVPSAASSSRDGDKPERPAKRKRLSVTWADDSVSDKFAEVARCPISCQPVVDLPGVTMSATFDLVDSQPEDEKAAAEAAAEAAAATASSGATSAALPQLLLAAEAAKAARLAATEARARATSAVEAATAAEAEAAEAAVATARTAATAAFAAVEAAIRLFIAEAAARQSASGSPTASSSSSSDDEPEPAKRMRLSADDQCPICCQPVDPCGATRPSTCRHAFCFDCLNQWRRCSTSCPIDRIQFDAVLVAIWPGQPPVRLPLLPVTEEQRQQRQLQQLQQQLQLHEIDAFEFDVCAVCRIAYRPEPEFEDMLICDHCEVTYHIQCLGPEQRQLLNATLADGQRWLCHDCALHLDQWE